MEKINNSVSTESVVVKGNPDANDKCSNISANIISADMNTSKVAEKVGEIEDSAFVSEDKTQQFVGEHKYELIGDHYYYTDSSTETRYRYDDSSGEWVIADETDKQDSVNMSSSTIFSNVTTTTTTTVAAVVSSGEGNVHVDEEGRTFYYADGRYLCQYPSGHVYYLNDLNEWVLWDADITVSRCDTDNNNDSNSKKLDDSGAKTRSNTENDANKWYFYKGSDAFYRDCVSNVIYKLNKSINEWEIFKEKVIKNKRKRKTKGSPEEEFDTESSSDGIDDNDSEDELLDSGTGPPGYKTDPSISYDGENYIKKDEDAVLYEWDANRRAWFPKLDETFMAQYQMSYGFNPDGSKNENPVKYDDDEDLDEEEEKAKEIKTKDKKAKKLPGWFEADDVHNTKVYVTGLPEDLSEQEFVDLMQKCGLVLKDPESGNYRIKMYKEKDGTFKGDALCTYIKVESVQLALQILDGSRVGPKGSHLIKVERATFQMKGEYDAKLKPKKKKKKVLDKLQKKQEKLFAWLPEPMRGQRGKHECVVVMRNAFALQEFEEHAEHILVHTEALRAQCASFGAVKKLELFDRHPGGVVRVAFTSVEAADLCIASMDGRLYCGRQLTVQAWDGKETFRVEETEEERAKRLKKWDDFLHKEGKIKEEGRAEGKSIIATDKDGDDAVRATSSGDGEKSGGDGEKIDCDSDDGKERCGSDDHHSDDDYDDDDDGDGEKKHCDDDRHSGDNNAHSEEKHCDGDNDVSGSPLSDGDTKAHCDGHGDEATA